MRFSSLFSTVSRTSADTAGERALLNPASRPVAPLAAEVPSRPRAMALLPDDGDLVTLDDDLDQRVRLVGEW